MIAKQDVIDWLEKKIRYANDHGLDALAAKPCLEGAISALHYLKQPVMPAEPTDEMLCKLYGDGQYDTVKSDSFAMKRCRNRYNALRALLMPKPAEPYDTLLLYRNGENSAWQVNTGPKGKGPDKQFFQRSEAERTVKTCGSLDNINPMQFQLITVDPWTGD